jgi:acyl-CoA synthetase (AMP-forming)/AMP-acid ligase II/peptidoglycan/LPS O-acetylase OafA/YrhL
MPPQLLGLDRLGRFGNRMALVSADEQLTYLDLAERVDEVGQRLGASSRRLVLVEAANEIETVVAYLGALAAGHAVILTDRKRSALVHALLATYDPDFVYADGSWRERHTGGRLDLHADLALLLSTSGSTGSPKLVRLSSGNLHSNAEAIAEYLNLTNTDVAISSLPLGYCYGLSVLHSHLLAGAAVAITDRSVVEPDFWALVDRAQVTSLAGVPETFALLERSGQQWYAAASLRRVTQAGGRLSPSGVRQLASLGADHGWRFFVMYGQTEATARMAYLPPEQALSHPHSVGRAVPGGRIRIDRPGPDGVGELVYAGPNVMMGYAAARQDLASGAELTELRTGDLAREGADGLIQIVGRTNRFAKIGGYRIDLERLEAALADGTRSVACVSDDHRLTVATTGTDAAIVRRQVSRLSGLPVARIGVCHYTDLPRLPNGKVDYAGLQNVTPASGGAHPDAQADLQAAYAKVLGYDQVEPTDSFVSLGGDSLSFVEMSLVLEERFSPLPRNWPELSIAELAAMGAPPPTPTVATEPTEPAAHRRAAWVRVDTSIALRALAVTLIVLIHLQVWGVRGGGHLLLALAGYTFARFALPGIQAADGVREFARSIARLAIPAVAFIALLVALGQPYGMANILLVNHYFGPPVWDARWNFWFVEALVEILVGMLVLFSVPLARRLERAHQLTFPLVLLAIGLVLRYSAMDLPLRFGRPHAIFWLFALGWLIHRAQSLPLKLLVSVISTGTLLGYFPDDPLRVTVVQAGLLILIWCTALPAPPLVARSVHRVAAGSLWIYLTHWVVWPFLQDGWGWPPVVTAAGCLVVGVVACDFVNRLQTVLLAVLRPAVVGLRAGAASPLAGPRTGLSPLWREIAPTRLARNMVASSIQTRLPDRLRT